MARPTRGLTRQIRHLEQQRAAFEAAHASAAAVGAWTPAVAALNKVKECGDELVRLRRAAEIASICDPEARLLASAAAARADGSYTAAAAFERDALVIRRATAAEAARLADLAAGAPQLSDDPDQAIDEIVSMYAELPPVLVGRVVKALVERFGTDLLSAPRARARSTV